MSEHTQPTEQEKKLWQEYHAMAMQSVVPDYTSWLSVKTFAEKNGLNAGLEIAMQATDMADCMLAEAKKRGMV